eukprot:1295465-Alexandrium_andersonii.AAC.1
MTQLAKRSQPPEGEAGQGGRSHEPQEGRRQGGEPPPGRTATRIARTFAPEHGVARDQQHSRKFHGEPARTRAT